MENSSDGSFGVKLMFFRRVMGHMAIWAGIFVFWLLLTRQHHPTLIVASSATAVLVSAFALAVYVNTFYLLPEFAKRRRWLQYLLSLLALVMVLDLIAVMLIQFIYDWLWGTDERRYSFWFNMATDGTGIIVHVLAAMGLMWMAKRFRKGSPSWPTVEG